MRIFSLLEQRKCFSTAFEQCPDLDYADQRRYSDDQISITAVFGRMQNKGALLEKQMLCREEEDLQRHYRSALRRTRKSCRLLESRKQHKVKLLQPLFEV